VEFVQNNYLQIIVHFNTQFGNKVKIKIVNSFLFKIYTLLFKLQLFNLCSKLIFFLTTINYY